MVVDSNILVYAICIDSPKNKKAQEFINKEKSNLQVAHQNIFETLRVLTHPKFKYPMGLEKAIVAIEKIAMPMEILTPKLETYFVALDLIGKHKLKGNKIFDAYLVATALTNGVNQIATDNEKDLKKYKGLITFNPF
ncbi:MAG: PIN domain-containing protein [bacterium]|nr:PIN domain-containing protein [bacterium]